LNSDDIDDAQDGAGAARLEWLEADGFGGFASGTALGPRTRRYHALLLCAAQPPGGRVVLVNGVEAWLETGGQRYPLTSQCYAPGGIWPPDAARRLAFTGEPWPSWRLGVTDTLAVGVEVFTVKATGQVVLRWRLQREGGQADGPVMLKVRPLLSGRDYHSLHHENGGFDFNAAPIAGGVQWRPYASLPAISARSNGVYTHEPDWYRSFGYAREEERGLDHVEDLATPGFFSFDLAREDAVLIFAAPAVYPRAGDAALQGADECGGEGNGAGEGDICLNGAGNGDDGEDALALAARLAQLETARRESRGGRLQRSADAYLVRRGQGLTLLAGFPWFTDWGRDTFIAMRGLLLATGRLREAGAILLEWSRHISQGMLPNRFPDQGSEPEYNSVDAALWFVVAVHDYLGEGHAGAAERAQLQAAVEAIIEGYAAGTRYGIGADGDGLLRAGVPGVQLTWMDAKLGDVVITPRIGKPVEVQALWINALRISQGWSTRWADLEARASASFAQRFPKPDGAGLYDVVDADHQAGKDDARVRPNQILAVGGLPHAVLQGAAAAAVVGQVEQVLLTPLGLRTLAPADPDYQGRYGGSPAQRDGAYHQGTVWPWLMGPFVQAWLRVQGGGAAPDAAVLQQARTRFFEPLAQRLDCYGLGHLPEVADGDAPHHPGGTPFQAWSLGELLRIERMLQVLTPVSAVSSGSARTG
jgi:glycogen debranching enzyme